jgi:hypothetical protein
MYTKDVQRMVEVSVKKVMYLKRILFNYMTDGPRCWRVWCPITREKMHRTAR